jgi:glycine/D-amino acid oxidase-like deaminating enzyme
VTAFDTVYDAVVIGAGIIGCAAALELSRDGLRVLCVDAGPAAGSGSTGASSAIVRFHYSDLTAVSAAWDSYFDWTGWADYLGIEGDARYVKTGALVLDSPGARRAETLRYLGELGIGYEELTAAEIRKRFPDISTTCYGPPAVPEDDAFWRDGDGDLGGYLTPDAGYLDDPQLAARDLLRAAARAGAEFRFGVMVERVIVTGGRLAGVAFTSGESVHAPVAVNAAGPASDRLNQLAGVTGDMAVRSRALRTETHEIPAPPRFRTGDGGVFVTDLDLGVAFRPHGQDRLHISCVEPECDPLDWVDDPWSFDTAVTQRIYDRQTLRAGRRLPGLAIPPRPSGIGALYDVTPDWRPIFDRSALPGFYLACGTSGNCFKIAPLAGRIVSALVRGGDDGFPLPHLGRSISLGYYSRLREVPSDAPRNVIG